MKISIKKSYITIFLIVILSLTHFTTYIFNSQSIHIQIVDHGGGKGDGSNRLFFPETERQS